MLSTATVMLTPIMTISSLAWIQILQTWKRLFIPFTVRSYCLIIFTGLPGQNFQILIWRLRIFFSLGKDITYWCPTRLATAQTTLSCSLLRRSPDRGRFSPTSQREYYHFLGGRLAEGLLRVVSAQEHGIHRARSQLRPVKDTLNRISIAVTNGLLAVIYTTAGRLILRKFGR